MEDRRSTPKRDTDAVRDFRLDAPPSPSKAIHSQCLHCVGGCSSEVQGCTSRLDQCSLIIYRLGKPIKDIWEAAGRPTRLRAIRLFCLACMGQSKRAVKECETYHCDLWLFRLGKNPNRARKKGRERAFRTRQGKNDA